MTTIVAKQEDRSPLLKAWTVLYGEGGLKFPCQAESIQHAISQCENAYPGEAIQSASLDDLKKIYVTYWDSAHYGCESQRSESGFFMEIDDRRQSNGQMFVDLGAEEGDVDDILSVAFEIGRLPGSRTDTQVAHVHFDGDNLAASIFKQGKKYILRPETGVVVNSTRLPNGEYAYIMESYAKS